MLRPLAERYVMCMLKNGSVNSLNLNRPSNEVSSLGALRQDFYMKGV